MILNPNCLGRVSIGNFPTGIVFNKEISGALDVSFFIKNEFEADVYGGGNKIRKLEYYLSHLEQNKVTDIVADGDFQSNCCMTLAHYCIPRGYNTHLILTGKEPEKIEGNYLQMQLSGAKTYEIGAWNLQQIEKKKNQIRKACEKEGRRVAIVETGLTNALTLRASIDLGKEIHNQQTDRGISFDYIFLATGTGGTHAGVEIYRQLHGLRWKIIGVSIANKRDYFTDYHRKLGKLLQGKIAVEEFNIITSHIDGGFGQHNQEDTDNMLNLRRRYGLILDSTYTYKCFDAIRELVYEKIVLPQSNVLFVHTGGINQRFILR